MWIIGATVLIGWLVAAILVGRTVGRGIHHADVIDRRARAAARSRFRRPPAT